MALLLAEQTGTVHPLGRQSILKSLPEQGSCPALTAQPDFHGCHKVALGLSLAGGHAVWP